MVYRVKCFLRNYADKKRKKENFHSRILRAFRSVFLSASLFVCLSIRRVFVCLSICLPVFLSFFLSSFLSFFAVYNWFFLWKVVIQNDIDVTSLSVQLKKEGRGLLREVYRGEGEHKAQREGGRSERIGPGKRR